MSSTGGSKKQGRKEAGDHKTNNKKREGTKNRERGARNAEQGDKKRKTKDRGVMDKGACETRTDTENGIRSPLSIKRNINTTTGNEKSDASCCP